VPAGGAREARNLAANRDRIEPGIQRISNGAAQRANLPDSRHQCWRFRPGHQHSMLSLQASDVTEFTPQKPGKASPRIGGAPQMQICP
jgi:hypothetical protein